MVVRTPFSRFNQAFRWLGVIILVTLCAACNPNQTAAPTATPAPAPPTATEANDGQPVAAALPNANRTLVVWAPDFAGVSRNDNAGNVLTSALRRFELSHPGLRLETHVKAETGTASLLNHLRSAQRVAPSILPDLVLINTQQLWQLVDIGLVPPLAPAEQPALTGYYPFAWNAVAYRERSYGFPYAAEVIQQVYNPETDYSPPTTWREALAGTGPWRYPAAGGGLFDNATVLLQYAGAGGVLMEDGSVSDPDALSAVFRFLTSARNQEVIPADVVETATFDEVWAAYVALPTGMVSVDSTNFLAHGGVTPTGQFAPIPTENGQPLTIANTWALAILTSEETKRHDALELVAALLDPEVLGTWSQYANVLPTTQAALAQWAGLDNYTAFLDVQLNAAIALPNGTAFDSFATEVIQAQIGVLTGNLTPAEAMEAVTGQEY